MNSVAWPLRVFSSSARVAHRVWDEPDLGTLLLTPPEEFVTAENLDRAYEWRHLNIGFGVTITGPHTIARMTNTLPIKRGDKVLEIGTRSGYQSAYLSNLSRRLVDQDHPRPGEAQAGALR
jgi:protein-L-isoaspartate(D-aspartate) O-methyltransferase